MAILKCYRIKEPRSASEQTQIDSKGPPVVSADLDAHWYVETDAFSASQVAVRTAVDPDPLHAGDPNYYIPSAGAPHPDNPYVFALGFNIRELGNSGRRWIVSVGYQSIGATQDPIDEPPTGTWEEQPYEAAIDQDAAGVPILNAADEGYDPPVQREFSDWIFTYSRNVATFNTAFWSPFRHSINSNVFRGFPAKMCKVMRISAQSRLRGNLAYFRLTVAIGIRDYYRKGQDGTVKQLGWTKLLENKGFRRKISAGKYEPILDELGFPTRTPVYLKADGSDKVTDIANANWREHQVFTLKDFSLMDAQMPGLSTL